jgi:hypothetical protein
MTCVTLGEAHARKESKTGVKADILKYPTTNRIRNNQGKVI